MFDLCFKNKTYAPIVYVLCIYGTWHPSYVSIMYYLCINPQVYVDIMDNLCYYGQLMWLMYQLCAWAMLTMLFVHFSLHILLHLH